MPNRAQHVKHMPLDTTLYPARVSRLVDSSQLRNIPGYVCPDREAYARQHGVAPYLVEAEERFKVRAESLIAKDWSTLDQAEAIRLRTQMDELCESIGLELEDAAPVFFDATAREFYAF